MQNIFHKILNQVENKKCIEEAIQYLREFGFKFYMPIYFFDHFPKTEIPEPYNEWQFLIRKSGKKLDTRLFFIIKLYGTKRDRIIVYRDGKLIDKIRMQWKDKADINFRKIVKRWKFPDELTYDERRKWRAEQKRVLAGRIKGSDWYWKYEPFVTEIKDPK